MISLSDVFSACSVSQEKSANLKYVGVYRLIAGALIYIALGYVKSDLKVSSVNYTTMGFRPLLLDQEEADKQ